jgi:2-iminoacetate synthase
MRNFKEIIATYDWDSLEKEIYAATAAQVRTVLDKEKITLEDFKILIAPAAKPFIEEMAQRSNTLTKKRFGTTMQMYIPLYLSNECQNICTYCGFSMTNKIKRKTLTDAEILLEVKYLKALGYDHVLLVTGEANRTVGTEYLKNAIELIRPHFSNISMEVQPLEQEEYEILKHAGLYAVLVYQETYHKATYKIHHPKGKKSNFDYRLDTPDRLGKAGIHKIGIGALFGLEDWRVDSFYTAVHLKYLQKTYWKTKYSISFPRLRPHEGDVQPKVEMSDADLVQLICAYRILDEDVELSMSTRESEVFRNHIISLGITSISAESRTNPGGYVVEPESLEQFEISDERSTAEIKEMLQSQGYEVVWKDWERNYTRGF